MKEKIQCLWTQQCNKKHLCCSSCSQKNCEWRCLDDVTKCKFIADTIEQEEVSYPIFTTKAEPKVDRSDISKELIAKLRKYKEENNLTLQDLAKLIDIPANLIQRILACDKVHMRALTENVDKLKNFLKDK